MTTKLSPHGIITEEIQKFQSVDISSADATSLLLHIRKGIGKILPDQNWERPESLVDVADFLPDLQDNQPNSFSGRLTDTQEYQNIPVDDCYDETGAKMSEVSPYPAQVEDQNQSPCQNSAKVLKKITAEKQVHELVTDGRYRQETTLPASRKEDLAGELNREMIQSKMAQESQNDTEGDESQEKIGGNGQQRKMTVEKQHNEIGRNENQNDKMGEDQLGMRGENLLDEMERHDILAKQKEEHQCKIQIGVSRQNEMEKEQSQDAMESRESKGKLMELESEGGLQKPKANGSSQSGVKIEYSRCEAKMGETSEQPKPKESTHENPHAKENANATKKTDDMTDKRKSEINPEDLIAARNPDETLRTTSPRRKRHISGGQEMDKAHRIPPAAQWISHFPKAIFDEPYGLLCDNFKDLGLVRGIKETWMKIKDKRALYAHTKPKSLKIKRNDFVRMIKELRAEGYITSSTDERNLLILFNYLNTGTSETVLTMYKNYIFSVMFR